MSFARVTSHLERARLAALQAADDAAQRAAEHPSLADLIEIESQLTDAETATRRLALIAEAR